MVSWGCRQCDVIMRSVKCYMITITLGIKLTCNTSFVILLSLGFEDYQFQIMSYMIVGKKVTKSLDK